MRPLLIVFLVFVAACAGRSDIGSSAEPQAAEVADTLPARFARTLVGTIAGDSVEVGLRLEEGTLSGWVYVPEEDGRGFSGPLRSDGSFALEGWSQEGTVSDTLVGTLRAGSAGFDLKGEIRGGGRAPGIVELREKRIAISTRATLVSRDLVLADSAAGWEAYAQLPVLVPAAGAALEPGEAAFNEAADALVREEIRAFGADVEPPGELPSDYHGPRLSTFEEAYVLGLAEDGLLSLGFGISVYSVGAAHPMYYLRTLTWDLTRGRAVELAELFRPDADILAVLSPYAMAAIERELGEFADAEWIATGAGPDPANYERWTLDREGLRLHFDPYQVAPYAAGPQVVVVPWEKLAPILDPAGPAARVAR